jgi:fructoselysine 6-kinase
MKIACFSVAALDFFPQQNEHYAGGNSLNQAVRFRQLGHETAFVGPLGKDAAGDRIFDLLRRAGVDLACTHRLEGETASNQLVNDEWGERFGLDGAWKNGVYADYHLSESDWDFMGLCDVWATHVNGPNFAEAVRRKPAGKFMAVDFLHLQEYDVLEKYPGAIDIAYFGGTRDMADDLLRISRRNKGLLVLTLGAEGSLAFEGGKTCTQPALPIEKVLDTTGCGDAFQAGFTSEYLKTGDISAALLAGAELGRLAASSFGGVPW